MKPCGYCGRENEDNASACRECGVEFAVPPAPEKQTPVKERGIKQFPVNEKIQAEILSELRKLRRSSKIGTGLAVALVAILILVVIPSVVLRVKRQLDASPGFIPKRSEWRDVSAAMSQSDYVKARFLAQEIVGREPRYYYGYAYLGNIALATGDLTNAEAQYARAYELFPNEDNEKNLAAVRKRLAKERTMPSLPLLLK